MPRIDKNNFLSAKELIAAQEIPEGLILVDKDKDWTSFDVVAKLRGTLKIKKIGHAGTLDPLATGLLIVCYGKATKTISEIQSQTKTYRAMIKLGAVTDSFDREFEEKDICDTSSLSTEAIMAAVRSFVGKIKQKAPMFSAKKVNGTRLYKLARKNESVEVKESDVEIYGINVLSIDVPFVDCEIICSKGTYIRSLARDIGSLLGVGGYLWDLRRTAIGDFKVDDAFRMPDLAEAYPREPRD